MQVHSVVVELKGLLILTIMQKKKVGAKVNKMTKEPHELIIFGKVERFTHSPQGNCLRLIDLNNKSAIWTGDKILSSFESKGNVCLHIKMVKGKQK